MLTHVTGLRYHEENPHEFDLRNVAFTGLGTGLLVASLVSLARSVSDLAVLGSEAVRQAFRLGVVVSEASDNLQCPDASGQADSWAYVLANVLADEVQRELDTIQEGEVRVSWRLPRLLIISPVILIVAY